MEADKTVFLFPQFTCLYRVRLLSAEQLRLRGKNVLLLSSNLRADDIAAIGGDTHINISGKLRSSMQCNFPLYLLAQWMNELPLTFQFLFYYISHKSKIRDINQNPVFLILLFFLIGFFRCFLCACDFFFIKFSFSMFHGVHGNERKSVALFFLNLNVIQWHK